MFVNRTVELAALRRWWDDPSGRLAMVWGRRRVGKTSLLQRFADGRRAVFLTAAGRPVPSELRLLSQAAQPFHDGTRDLVARPFADWDDALEVLSDVAATAPVLLVIDEFPELLRQSPELPGVLRAHLDRASPGLKVLLCGSAVRTMTAAQEERAPLYGRVDLRLLVHPFAPSECAALLPALSPADRARVWTIVGGVPLYLSWWDQEADLTANLERLVLRPDGRLLAEGQLVLATEVEGGPLAGQVLRAIASGRTRYHEINDAVRADAGRVLDRMVELRLVERVVPVTEDPRRTRRRTYRIADNFLGFWLGLVDRLRGEIERGLGPSILPVLLEALDEHSGPRWEEAFRSHLRRLAAAGHLGEGVLAVGPYWRESPAVEIDAVALAGRARTPVLAGEAKWAPEVDGRRLRRQLEAKARLLPGAPEDLRLAVAARERVTDPGDLLVVTAADIFP